ncbi:MAG: ATP-binding cassette domain-containing protein [Alkalibacterium sp.]|uniref:ATP-binding cassette domain-containing protein n=1 Tax=Alkalibacterium sp. TaxID=1872447 RepID=UPI003970F433
MKLFFKYVSLNMLGMLGISFYILADTFFIAQALGPTGIAALNLSIPAFGIIHGFGLMMGIGGATRYKILLSQDKREQAKKVYSQTVLFALAFGVLFLVVGQFGSEAIARFSGADVQTFDATSVYLKTILSFAPFFVLNNTLLSFIRNDGDPSLAMFGMVIGSVLNVVLDYIFIFPLQMGMFGAALATSISPLISLGVLMIHYFKPKNNLAFTFQKVEKPLIQDITYLGSSAFVNEITHFEGISFRCMTGEVLCFSGLVGSGRSELMQTLFGFLKKDSGAIVLNGEEVTFASPPEAMKNGIAFLPEDRKIAAAISTMNVRENMSIAVLPMKLSNFLFVNRRKEKSLVKEYINSLSIKTDSMENPITTLSGGNQQKVILARWLAMGGRILIVDEPTQGVDVGSKAEIHRILRGLAQQGIAVIVVSSDLPEVLSLADRIIVMRSGTIAGELDANDATEEAVMELATVQAC